MPMLKTTAIMKTDIGGSTARFRTLPDAELEAVLAEHRQFVARVARAHDGHVVKPEGDGFWLVFPSVTAAALAAMSMQEELRLAQPGRGDARLRMRIVLAVGDVLHQEGALVGDAVVLAARLEAITPLDEIYLPASAWLAVRQAQVRAALVDTVSLKGFPDPVAVFRIEQHHRMQVIVDQCIVVTDLRRFVALMTESPLSVVERVLDQCLELVSQVCAEFAGTHRGVNGDAYLLTFEDTSRALAAVERLADGWDAFLRRESVGCTMNVGVHKGTLYAFRSYLLSPDVNTTFNIVGATSRLAAETSIFVSGVIRKEVAGTPWEARLDLVDVQPPRLGGIEIYRLRRP
jgi:class 3 adenylate cyclase